MKVLVIPMSFVHTEKDQQSVLTRLKADAHLEGFAFCSLDLNNAQFEERDKEVIDNRTTK